jgi:hypothetical protein
VPYAATEGKKAVKMKDFSCNTVTASFEVSYVYSDVYV